ncbi:MAG TPA: MFS transporter [Actinospica sp.]|nr:MFS transporter [Actinospica sp.]
MHDTRSESAAGSAAPAKLGDIRDFRFLWVSGLLAGLGAQMTSIALPLLVLRETHSPVRAGAVETVAVAALLVTMLPGGALADSVERRRLMRICDLLSTIAVGALAVTALLGRPPYVLALLVATVSAIISSLYGPAALGLLRAMVPRELLGTASARLQARGATARLVGPMVGGLLYAVQPSLPFFGEAGCLLISTTCVALVRTRSAPDGNRGSAFSRTEFTAGVTFLWKRPHLRTVLLVFGLGVNASFSAMMFIALAVTSHGGSSGVNSGTVVSLTAAGSLAGALLAPRISPRLRLATLIGGTCWACAAVAAGLTVSLNPVYVGVLCALCIAFAAVASIGFMTSLLDATPQHMVGRVQSAAGFISSIVQPLGPLVGGILLASYGTSSAYLALCAVLVVCAVVLTCARSVRHAPAPALATE